MQMIVCAANKYGDRLVLGVRHHDALMQRVLRESDYAMHQRCDEEQGFVDNRGNFLSRTEAWKVAEEAGQIIHRCGGDTANGGTLYSENLY